MIIKLQKTSFQTMRLGERWSQGKANYRRSKTADLEILTCTAGYEFLNVIFRYLQMQKIHIEISRMKLKSLRLVCSICS